MHKLVFGIFISTIMLLPSISVAKPVVLGPGSSQMVTVTGINTPENTIEFTANNESYVIDDLFADSPEGTKLIVDLEQLIQSKQKVDIDYAVVQPDDKSQYNCKVALLVTTTRFGTTSSTPFNTYYVYDKDKSYLKIDPLADYRFVEIQQRLSMASKAKPNQPTKEFSFFQITSSTIFNEAVKVLEKNNFYFDKNDPTNISGTGNDPIGRTNYNIDNDPLFKSVTLAHCKSTQKVVGLLIRLKNGVEAYKALESKYGKPNFCDGHMKPPFCISYWGDIDKETLFRGNGSVPPGRTYMRSSNEAIVINFGENETSCLKQSETSAKEKSSQLEKRAGAAF